MAEMDKEVYKSKKALPNKLLQADGSITDLAGNAVIGATPVYEGKSALPNKWLNPDGTYSTLSEIITGTVDTELFIVVDELPASGKANKIYLLVQDDNKVIEYIWTNNKWNPVGMVEFDLNNYYTKDQVTQLISSALQAAKDYADTLFSEISIDPQVFFWNASSGQTAVDLWNDIYDAHLKNDVILTVRKSMSGGYDDIIGSCGIKKNSMKDTTSFNCFIYGNTGYNSNSGIVGTHMMSYYKITINVTLSDNVVTKVDVSLGSPGLPYIKVDYNYSTPYTPKYPGSPATKKYVDDSIEENITSVLGGSY